jgi:hypothetical protein
VPKSNLKFQPTVADVCDRAAALLGLGRLCGDAIAKRNCCERMNRLGWSFISKSIVPDWTKPTITAIEVGFVHRVRGRSHSRYITSVAFADSAQCGLAWALAIIGAVTVDEVHYVECDVRDTVAAGLGWDGTPSQLYTVADVSPIGIVTATVILDRADGTVLDGDLFALSEGRSTLPSTWPSRGVRRAVRSTDAPVSSARSH